MIYFYNRSMAKVYKTQNNRLTNALVLIYKINYEVVNDPHRYEIAVAPGKPQ